jgi:K+-sensing histidine kinase KdpD
MSFLAGIQRTPLIQPLRIFTHYLLPVLAVLTALQTNLWIAPSLGVLPPYLTFVAAVMITAWFGGFLPAVFAIVLSALIINYYFIPPVH